MVDMELTKIVQGHGQDLGPIRCVWQNDAKGIP
jgi:hypothetical protein